MNKSNQKSQVMRVIINIVLVVVACAFAIPLFAYAQGPAIELTEDGKVPGQPFDALQQQVDTMKQQIADLQTQTLGNELVSTTQTTKELTIQANGQEYVRVEGELGQTVLAGYASYTISDGLVWIGEGDVHNSWCSAPGLEWGNYGYYYVLVSNGHDHEVTATVTLSATVVGEGHGQAVCN